jgi:hypothetical protein
MTEEKTDYHGGIQQFNAADLLKRNTVMQIFKTLDDACIKQETISDNSFDTSFTKRVELIEALLWKYTPSEIKEEIKQLHTEMETTIKNIDPKLSENNKLLTKTKISYDYRTEIFKLLEVVLTNSPISVEYVEMEIKGDYKELIKNIRTNEPVKIFSEVEEK